MIPKTIYCLLCMLLLSAFTFSQSVNWQWATQATGHQQEGVATAVDWNSNVYLTGEFQNGVQFNNTNFQNPLPDYFLASYSPSGAFRWVKAPILSSGSTSSGTGLAIDGHSNIYVTGTFAGGYISMDTITLTANTGGNWTFFVCKYDTSGQIIWARAEASAETGGGNNGTEGKSVTTDNSGNVICAGTAYGNNISFGNITLPVPTPNGPGSTAGFVVKYSGSGNVLWADTLTWVAMAVTTDDFNNVYVTGALALGDNDGFLAKYDSSGQLQWVKSITGWVTPMAIETDKNNHLYITGEFDNTLNFGSVTLIGANNSNLGADFFLLKCDTGGNAIWGKRSGQLNRRNAGYGLTSDGDNNIYVSAGFTSNTVTFDSVTLYLPPVNTDPMFIMVFDSNGKALCGTALPSGGDDQSGISISRTCDLYLGGDFMPDTFALGNNYIFNQGIENAFVAKFNFTNLPACNQTCNLASPNITPTTTSICPTDSAQICAPANFASYTWNNNNGTGKCIQAKTAGNYYLTVTDNNGCTAESNHVSITAFPSPPVSISQSGDTLRVYNETNVQWYLNNNPIPNATQNIYIAHTFGNYTVSVTDTNGCTSFSLPTRITGIQDISEYENISIYPNPLSAGKWQLSVDNNLIGAQIEILDDNGRIVYKSEIKTTHSEIATQFENGIYLLRITTGARTAVRKLVKL